MNVLVIGGTRFIGAHVVRHLHEAGAAVTVLHRGTSTNPILPEVEHVTDQLVRAGADEAERAACHGVPSADRQPLDATARAATRSSAALNGDPACGRRRGR